MSTRSTVLFVANSGGHLVELLDLRQRFGLEETRSHWVTFDGAQTRRLLAGEDVEYLPYVDARDLRAAARNAWVAAGLLRRRTFTHAISTGSSIAVSFLGVAACRGVSCHYVESATRIEGPSMTGRLLRAVPGVHLYTQHRSWADDRWAYRGSVFDRFMVEEVPERPVHRVVVSLGSSKTFGFRRLLERLVAVLPRQAEVLWQTGSSDVGGLGIDARPEVDPDDLASAMQEADVVIAHAGIGTSITALRAGKRPLLVPREAAHGEHVDDHQGEVADALGALNLASVARVSELGPDDVRAASGWGVRSDGVAPPFKLDGTPHGRRWR